MGKGGSSSNPAAETQSRIAQEQWDFYKELFQPEEQALAKQAMAPVDLGSTLGQIDNSVSQAKGFRDEAMARELGRFGGRVDGRLGDSLQDRADLDSTRVQVNARNTVRRRAPELQTERLMNVIQMGQGIPTEAVQGLGAAASNATALQIARNNAGVGLGTAAGGMLGLGAGQAGGKIQNWWQDRQAARLGQQALQSEWGASLADPWSAA